MSVVLTTGLLGGACTSKNEASDKICAPNQRFRCNDCTKPDPSDTRVYRGWQHCSADGKSFVGQCGECGPDDGDPQTRPPTDPPPPQPPPTGGGRPGNAPPPDGGVPNVRNDGGDPDPAGDGGIGSDLCPGGGAPSAGDLAVVELMIATVANGATDDGEWFEVQNTRNCRLNLNGLRIESPRGSENDVDSLQITQDVFLGPHDTFLVADTVPAADNGNLLGTVFVWTPSSDPSATTTRDSLRDSGDDKIVVMDSNRNQIDLVSWNAADWGIEDATSVSFSQGCSWPERSNWGNWAWSSASWTDTPTRMYGTPNLPNADVACAHVP
jgi:hypothetical protein